MSNNTANQHDEAFATLAGLDPEVIKTVQEQTKRQEARTKTSSQRAKAKADKKRRKATFDLPAELIKAIAEIAKTEGVNKSNLAAELLTLAVRAYHAGKLDFARQKRPARSLRWDWEIELTELET